MAELKIEKVGYQYPNLIFSIGQTVFHIVLKDGSGKKRLGWKMVDRLYVYHTIENDMNQPPESIPVRNLEKFILDVFNNFFARMDNTNEEGRTWLWNYRRGVYGNKTGEVGS